MAINELVYSGRLATTNCWCGIHYAIPAELLSHIQQQHRDGREQSAVYCPLGHAWILSGCGKAAELEAQLERERARAGRLAAARDQAQASAAAYKGAATKARKRAAAAVCPCCNRSFVQLRRHLEAKHPEYTGELT